MLDILKTLNEELEGRRKFTTIFKIGLTEEGQFKVGRNDAPINGWLDDAEILAAIPGIEYAPVTSQDPFFTTVYGRQRMVFTLDVDAWFFEQTLAPFTLKNADPYNNFVSQVRLGDDPDGFGRSKTIYVDNNNKIADQIFIYNLFVDVWQEASNFESATTPIIIDPKVRNGGGD